jgi:hypothetical protein
MEKKQIAISSKPIEDALQGLAHWISYRQTLCHEHHINEGALVAEFVLLLRAQLDKSFGILNEEEYSKGNKKRMDIGIIEKDNGKKIAVIEVKRSLAGTQDIKKDIAKLAELKKGNKGILCYLAVISEKNPPGFLEENKTGTGKVKFKLKKKNEKPVLENAKLVKLLKSTGAFYGKEGNVQRANYCCLLEVLCRP